MRAIIIGAGDAGQQLAARLCEEKHDVVVIDHRDQPLQELSSQLDIMTIRGPATSLKVLEEAGVDKAGLVAAVTNRDEINILSALLASTEGAAHTAARVSNSEYTDDRHLKNLAKLGVELIVNEHEECAHEVARILNMSGSNQVVEMVNGRILVVGFKLPEDSPLLEGPLQSFPEPDLLKAVRVIAVMRQEELIMPDGEMRFKPNDTVYFVGLPPDARAFLNAALPDQLVIDKVIVAGGGDSGLRIAQHVEKTGKQVVLMERDEERAHECAAEVDKAMVIANSSLNKEALEEIGITSNTAIVAATGNDEDNIIVCLLARKLGAAFAVALVSEPDYVPIINEAGLLDRAVSPYMTTINAILRFVRGTNIRAATLLQNVPGELLEVVISSESKWQGKALKDIPLPKHAIATALIRGDDAGVVTGETVLQPGDHLIIFAAPGVVAKLETVFRK
ncbi:MAG: Trk system potassium transporter TrkA [Lentisphaerae bacterium]|nr:Trk system potassium transporter TrkA [Lentisphaerota bacterium]